MKNISTHLGKIPCETSPQHDKLNTHSVETTATSCPWGKKSAKAKQFFCTWYSFAVAWGSFCLEGMSKTKAVVLLLIVMNYFVQTDIEQTQLLSYNPNTLFSIFLKKFKIRCSLFSAIPQFHIQMHQFWCTRHKLSFSLTTSAAKTWEACSSLECYNSTASSVPWAHTGEVMDWEEYFKKSILYTSSRV